MRRTAILYLVYLAAGLALLPAYRWRISPDTTSYISIAEAYAAGDWGAAVNAYWGPLYSWLLAFFVKAGVNPLVGCKLISLAAGLALLEAARRVMALAGVERALALWLLPAAALMVLAWVLGGVVTPDVLLTALVLWYLVAVLQPPTPKSALACGILGGLAYLAKSFALPFFLAHFLLVAAWRRAGAYAAAGTAAFAVIALPWAAALGAKYGQPMFSSVGREALDVAGPANPGRPVLNQGLFPPWRSGAFSAWEDPTYAPPVPSWNPLESLSSFLHFANVIGANLPVLYESFVRTSYLSLAIVPLALGLVVRRGPRNAAPMAIILAAVVLFVAGYSLVLVRPRYLWPVSVMVLIMAGWLLGEARRLALPRIAFGLVAAVVVISFCIAPVRQLTAGWKLGREIPRQAGALRALGVSGRIASNDFNGALFMCYYLRASCFGMPKFAAGTQSVRQELARHGIDYFLLFGKAAEAPPYLEGYRAIPGGPPGIAVYRRE